MMLGAFAACSDNDALTAENGGAGTGEATGTSYVSLAISLPTQGTSIRAASEVFDDGLPGEYKVKDATIVLFEGTSEATATYAGAYNLDLFWTIQGESTDHITSTAKIVQKVKSPSDEAHNYYAFVFLNSNEALKAVPVRPEFASSDTEVLLSERRLQINGTEANGITTLASLYEAVANGATATSNPFISSWGDSKVIMMCNAPLNNKPGYTAEYDPSAANKISWLSEIDKTRIYASRAEAEANPATVVNVERAVAKVTVSDRVGSDAEHKLTGPAKEEDQLPYEIVGWQLDNTNKSSYVVRNLGAAPAGTNPAWLGYKSQQAGSLYRFAGSSPVYTATAAGETGSTSFYRIYWGEDPNYGSNPAGSFNLLKDATGWEYSGLGHDNPLYCLENTFNVAQMKDDQTTRAVVKVKFNGGEDFYVINSVTETLDMVTAKKGADGAVTSSPEEELKSRLAGLFLTMPEVSGYIPTILDGADAKLDATNLQVTLTEDAAKGMVSVASVELVPGTTGLKAGVMEAEVNAKFAEQVVSLNAMAQVRHYAGGFAYYPVRIMHFGDDLTPWNSWESTAGASVPSIGGIYPGANAEKNYLGRYGVLRNNWYDLGVTSIKFLGSPVIPEFTGTDDDTIDAYISVRINILSWALRKQSVDL